MHEGRALQFSLGTVAGMIQYKHASVAAFEGYAGTSASGFRAEVEAQCRLGQTDDLLDYFDRRQGGASLGGPAGPRIGRTLDDAAVQLGPLPAMIADRARLRVMLASVARTFHVGPLADCFFDPATALCLKRVTTPDPAQPLTLPPYSVTLLQWTPPARQAWRYQHFGTVAATARNGTSSTASSRVRLCGTTGSIVWLSSRVSP